MTKKKPSKRPVKKSPAPTVAPSTSTTTIQDLLEAGAALEKRVRELEVKVASLERGDSSSVRGHLSPQVTRYI